MALTVREKISARLLSLVDGVEGVTAVRPQRVHWAEQVTQNLTAIVRQGQLEFEHDDGAGAGDAGAFICKQDYEIPLAVVPSDSATASYETEMNRVMADIIEALAADPDLNGNAEDEGLVFGTVTPIEDDAIAGETLHLTVTFRTGRTDMEVNRR
jgi:hypothetical protein